MVRRYPKVLEAQEWLGSGSKEPRGSLEGVRRGSKSPEGTSRGIEGGSRQLEGTSKVSKVGCSPTSIAGVEGETELEPGLASKCDLGEVLDWKGTGGAREGGTNLREAVMSLGIRLGLSSKL